MKIANIITKDKITVPEEINVVQSMEEIIHGLPTLIIGFDYVNKHYPEFDIFDIKLGENLYWTFKRTEKRDKHSDDLSWFINKAYLDLCENVKYIFLDLIQFSNKNLIKSVRKILSTKTITTYLVEEMAYIYVDGFIFGLDLKLAKYVGLNLDKLKNKLITKSSVFLRNDDILIEYKNYIEELGIGTRFLPLIYFIRNEQNNTISNFYISRES